jgi:hypothetical protein
LVATFLKLKLCYHTNRTTNSINYETGLLYGEVGLDLVKMMFNNHNSHMVIITINNVTLNDYGRSIFVLVTNF